MVHRNESRERDRDRTRSPFRNQVAPEVAGLESRQLLSTVTPARPAPGERAAELRELAEARAESNRQALDEIRQTEFRRSLNARILSSEQIQRRIENLPFFLRQVPVDRILNRDAILEIQNGLRQLEGTLTPPALDAISGFNQTLQDALPFENLAVSEQRSLDFAFRGVLASSQADPEVVDRIATGLTELAHSNAAAPQSALVTSQDYALVLQTALAAGRRAPQLPGF